MCVCGAKKHGPRSADPSLVCSDPWVSWEELLMMLLEGSQNPPGLHRRGRVRGRKAYCHDVG